MNKLIIMYMEDKNNPENTWSGTSYALRKAMEKYANVIFIDSSVTVVMSFVSKVYGKLSHTVLAGTVGRIYEFMETKHAKKLLSPHPGVPVLEIGNDVPLENPFYLYHDLSYASWVESNKKIRALGKNFSDGNLDVLSPRELKRKIQLEEQLFCRAEKVFYMGGWIADAMQRQYPQIAEKFVHAGGGLNRNFRILESNHRNPHQIVFVGIDFERKGGDLVLEAFRILRKEMDPKATLMIIGPDKEESEDGVTWCGRLKRDQIGKILSNSGVFCMPSRFEAYGLVFLEALCFGLPVIARDDYEMRRFVEDGKSGYLLKEESAEELAKLMDLAIRNTKMQRFVQDNRDRYMQTYDWDSVAQNIAKIIFA